MIDASASMMEEFRAPATHTQVVEETIDQYESVELFVRQLPFEAKQADIEALFQRELMYKGRHGIKDIRMHRVGKDQMRKQGEFAGHLTLVMNSVDDARRALAKTKTPIPIADFGSICELRMLLHSLKMGHLFANLVNQRWDYTAVQQADDSDWEEMGISAMDAAKIKAGWKPPKQTSRKFGLQFLPSSRQSKKTGGRGAGRGGRAGGRGACFICGGSHKAAACPKRSLFNQQQTTRMRVVQDGFTSFSTRIMSLLQPLALGLLTFGNEVHVECELTDVLEDFNADLEKLKASGQTALWDGISTAVERLAAYRAALVEKGQTAPLLRVVALTDGMDNKSKTGPEKLANELLENGVMLDCVLVGSMYDKKLPAVARLTGGEVLIPDSPLDAITKLEAEAMLKVAWRPDCVVVDKSVVGNFKRIEQLLRSGKTATKRKRQRAEASTAQPTASTLQDIVDGVVHESSSSSSARALSAADGKRTARIMREFVQFTKDVGRDRMRHFMCGDDVDRWDVLLQGPSDSVYDGVFQLTIEFGDRYPVAPPTIRFRPGTIKHVNIDSTTGRVCSQAFGSAYTSTMTVHDLLIAVRTPHCLRRLSTPHSHRFRRLCRRLQTPIQKMHSTCKLPSSGVIIRNCSRRLRLHLLRSMPLSAWMSSRPS